MTQVFIFLSWQCCLSFNCPLSHSLPLSVCVSQIQSLVTDSAGHKLLVLSGQSSDHGGLLLQTGVFTYQTLSSIFADPGVSQIYCPLTLNDNLMKVLHCTVINACQWFDAVWYELRSTVHGFWIHFRDLFVSAVDKKNLLLIEIQKHNCTYIWKIGK